MTLHLIPAFKGHGRHRGKTPAQLRRELDEATCHLIALTTENDELRTERNQLAAQLDTADREQKRLEAALQAWEARWANAHPVSVPAPRDLRPSDERPTVPTDVSAMRAVFAVAPIAERPTAPDADDPIKCPAPPEAATPGHVPAWAFAGEPGPAV